MVYTKNYDPWQNDTDPAPGNTYITDDVLNNYENAHFSHDERLTDLESFAANSGGFSPSGVIVLDTADAAAAGTAINNAISALPSTGGKILVPYVSAGWYIDTPILWNKNGIILEGVGMLASQLIYDPAVITAGAIKMADTTQRFGTIRDLMIDATGTSGGIAIDASYFVNSQFERLRIGNGTTFPNKGIVFNSLGTYYNTVRDCRIQVVGAGSYGLFYDNNANSNFAYNVRILGDSNTVGVRLGATGPAHTNTLVHIDCEGTMAIGIQVGGYNTTLISPYIESITVGIQIEAGVEAFSCIGGFVSDCDDWNFLDLGADNPSFIGVWKQYETFNRVAEPNLQRIAQVMKDPGATTVTSLGLAAPTLTATVSNADDASGALLQHATTAVANNVSGIISAFTQARRDWDPRVDIRIKTQSGALTNIRMLAGLFSASPDAVPIATAVQGAWFRYDTSLDGTAFWRCVCSNGTTTTVVTTIIPVTVSTKYQFTIEFEESPSRVRFYIDKIPVATIVTNTPAASTLLGYGIRVTTLAAVSANIRWGLVRLMLD